MRRRSRARIFRSRRTWFPPAETTRRLVRKPGQGRKGGTHREPKCRKLPQKATIARGRLLASLGAHGTDSTMWSGSHAEPETCQRRLAEIGRASCRERGEVWGVGGPAREKKRGDNHESGERCNR